MSIKPKLNSMLRKQTSEEMKAAAEHETDKLIEDKILEQCKDFGRVSMDVMECHSGYSRRRIREVVDKSDRLERDNQGWIRKVAPKQRKDIPQDTAKLAKKLAKEELKKILNNEVAKAAKQITQQKGFVTVSDVIKYFVIRDDIVRSCLSGNGYVECNGAFMTFDDYERKQLEKDASRKVGEQG